MYESRREKPVSHRQFIRRLLWHVAGSVALLAASLGIGIAGYVAFEGLTPLEAFLNASMLLGGMGPVDLPRTAAGKLFAGCYALYSGLVFLVAAGLLLAPTFHRLIHKFHWDDETR